MKFIISHPTGNENVRGLLKGLFQAGMLERFYTSFASFPGSWLDQLGTVSAFAEIRRRRYDKQIRNLTRTRSFYELGRLLSGKLGWHGLTRQETGPFCIDAVYRHLDKWVAQSIRRGKQPAEGVYAYEDGALQTFIAAKQSGLSCHYDLPIGYWRYARQICEIEQERWPEWIPTLTSLKDSEAKLEQKDRELSEAQKVYVASTFTKQTLNLFPGSLPPVQVVPYGFPPVPPIAKPKFRANQKLRLLFVGGLSQRKGIADLFWVARQLERFVSLTIVGRKMGGTCTALEQELSRHCWIPSLPHHELLSLMQRHDVLVFPSLFEGFGLVITEAMSQGLPVITTERTIGPDFIRSGENGWLTPAGNMQQLKSTIEQLLHYPKSLAEVAHAARQTAAQRPWIHYGHDMCLALTGIAHSLPSNIIR